MPSQTIILHLDPDDRLAAAIGGAIRYYADNAGLENDTILQLQCSVLAACKYFFDACHGPAQCDVSLRRSDDRLEVELQVQGSALKQGNDKFSWPGIDEVHAETLGDVSRLRLTKRLASAPQAN